MNAAPEIKLYDGPEPFALIQETCKDYERIAREAAQKKRDQEESEKRQTTMF